LSAGSQSLLYVTLVGRGRVEQYRGAPVELANEAAQPKALLDAIIATADYAQDKGKRRRKALVVISDGYEKNSSSKERSIMVMQLLQTNDFNLACL
jgi:hypothetical protein